MLIKIKYLNVTQILVFQPGRHSLWRSRLELVFVQEFGSRDEAFSAERQIKNWSRKKKEALINGEWGNISLLAKKKFDD